jgi:hypothetical protein
MSSIMHWRQMPRQFSSTTAGQQRNDWRAALWFCHWKRAISIHDRVTDELDTEPRRVLGVPFFLERKNAYDEIKVMLHAAHTPRSRCPNLR